MSHKKIFNFLQTGNEYFFVANLIATGYIQPKNN